MNLKDNPNEIELASLLLKCGDNEAHHRCIVLRSGWVLYPLNEDVDLDDPNIKFFGEILTAGGGYVGWDAATDSAYVRRHMAWLQEHWENGDEGFQED